jgi:hypothetical protein
MDYENLSKEELIEIINKLTEEMERLKQNISQVRNAFATR